MANQKTEKKKEKSSQLFGNFALYYFIISFSLLSLSLRRYFRLNLLNLDATDYLNKQHEKKKNRTRRE